MERIGKNKDWGLRPEHYKQLGKKTKVSDILALIEEEFRYHQFYAAMTIVLLGFGFGWIFHQCENHILFVSVLVSSFVLALFAGIAGCFYYWFYASIAKHMLRVGEVKFQTDIRHRAYELYEKQGKREGHALEDWLDAEAELLQPKRPAAAK